MPNLKCGIDFGTTNSSAALFDGEKAHVLDLDVHNDLQMSLPSLLYMSREGEAIVGRAAANAFIERNIDREVIYQQVELGVDIEAYVSAELDNDYGSAPQKDPSDTRSAMRARAMVEVNSPGRLFQSLKSSLRFRQFKGTEVFGRQYQIEELISLILRRIKEKVDAAAGHNVVDVVLGRPVHFSTDSQDDELAERRLRTAAQMAGFENIAFIYEPVAACVEYAAMTEKKQRLMVVDIGGGTCDVCVMEFGGSHGVAARLAEGRVLGVGGVPIAGDAIDREIIRAKVFPALGSRARYGPSRLPMPQHIYAAISDWQRLYKLNNEEIINWLIAVEGDSTQPDGIRALRFLIQRNLGYPLTRKVEAAKKRLTTEWEATIEFHDDPLQLSIELDRSEFTHIIEHTLEDMLASIHEAESAAHVRAEDVDYVLTTGGTSLIPAVRRILHNRFGEAKLIERDTFTSVATGLAVIAQYT